MESRPPERVASGGGGHSGRATTVTEAYYGQAARDYGGRMGIPTGTTAHLDTFARDHLPAPDQQPVYLWDHPSLDYPNQLNCGAELLDGNIAEHGDRPCLVAADGTTWTYRETLDWANRIANVLIHEHGLVPGNRVLVRGPNNPWLGACWLALQKAGLIAVVTMPMLRAGELRAVIDKAEVNLALCDSRYLDELRSAAPDVLTLSYGDDSDLSAAIEAASPTFDNCPTAADDVSLIAFTSGTTGEPKGCVHFHRDVLAIADTFAKHVVAAEPSDVFAGSPPLAFTFGLGGLLIFPLRAGASAVLLEAAGPPQLLQAIADLGVTITFTAPTAYRAMLANLGTVDHSSLRKGVAAGEALPLAIRVAWREATGVNLIDGLGSTEMLHVFISATPEDVVDGTVGVPVPGFEAVIMDDDGNELPDGEIGKLAVRGPTGCRYLADSRQTNYVRGGWNYPGDSMRRGADGNFTYIARADDMIISAGYNIAGPEVEAALLTHPAVGEVACVAAPDDQRGYIVKAYVVLRPGHDQTPEMARALQDHVKASIAPYKYPRQVEFRSELPKTQTGKLQRFRLREEAAG